MKKGIKRKDGLWLTLALAVLIALLLSVTGCDPCARLARRCPPASTVQDSVWVHDSVWVERWQKEVVGISDTARAETAYACAVSFVMGKSMVLRLWNKDSADMLVKQLNEMKVQLREAYSHRSETKVVTQYRCRTIVKIGAWIGLAAVLSLFGYLAARIVSIVKKK